MARRRGGAKRTGRSRYSCLFRSWKQVGREEPVTDDGLLLLMTGSSRGWGRKLVVALIALPVAAAVAAITVRNSRGK